MKVLPWISFKIENDVDILATRKHTIERVYENQNDSFVALMPTCKGDSQHSYIESLGRLITGS